MLVVLVCLVSFWSVTFLMMELLSFAVEVGVYTFIGVIVTVDVTGQYISIVFFLLFYGHRSVSLCCPHAAAVMLVVVRCCGSGNGVHLFVYFRCWW